MTHQEAETLLGEAGLRIERAVPVASLPLSDKRLWLPIALVEPVERALRRWPGLAPVAQDIVYVCAPAARR